MKHSNQLSYRGKLASSNHKFMHVYTVWIDRWYFFSTNCGPLYWKKTLVPDYKTREMFLIDIIVRYSSLKKRISFHEDIVREDKQEDLFSRKEDEAARVLQRNWKKYNNQVSRGNWCNWCNLCCLRVSGVCVGGGAGVVNLFNLRPHILFENVPAKCLHATCEITTWRAISHELL